MGTYVAYTRRVIKLTTQKIGGTKCWWTLSRELLWGCWNQLILLAQFWPGKTTKISRQLLTTGDLQENLRPGRAGRSLSPPLPCPVCRLSTFEDIWDLYTTLELCHFLAPARIQSFLRPFKDLQLQGLWNILRCNRSSEMLLQLRKIKNWIWWNQNAGDHINDGNKRSSALHIIIKTIGVP